LTCPKCGAANPVAGRIDVNGERAHVAFRPSGLRLLTLRRSTPLVLTFRACTDCGHLWNRVSAPALRDLVDASAAPELVAKLRRRAATPGATGCPRCGDTVYVEGGLAFMGAESFEPDRLRDAPLFRRRMMLHGGVRACADCGHVWSMVDPAELRRMIQP
jgi:hypothetical protein